MEKDVSGNTTVKDPVCGMDVRPGHARGWDYLYHEIVYHFCGPDCRYRFQLDPKAVLQAGPGGQPKPPSGREEKAWWSTLRGLIKKWRKR
jgi:YHS domain-containing protein